MSNRRIHKERAWKYIEQREDGSMKRENVTSGYQVSSLCVALWQIGLSIYFIYLVHGKSLA